MTAVLAVAAALLGLAAGFFLEIVAERVPQKLPLTRPWPAGTGVRRPLLAVACAALFAATAVRFGFSYHLPAYLVLAAGVVVLSAIDLEHRLLPNRVVYPTGIAVGALLFLAALAEAEPRFIAWALLGGVGSFVLFFVLHFISPQGMAFGDVRLSLVLGMATGWLGLGRVPLFLFSSFVFAAVVGLVFAALSGRGLKTAIPFGPFLAVGAELAIFLPAATVDRFLGL